MKRRTLTSIIACTTLALLLTGCTSAAQPDEITWEMAAEGEIVAIDDTAGVYVQGQMTFGSGNIDSKGVIDYTYAYLTDDGGIRQGLISDLYEKLDNSGDYPGSQAVTIYQDAGDANNAPRVEIYRCIPNATDDFNPFLAKTCVMPDGSDMGWGRLRVDIHVPVGAVVNADSLQPDEPADQG